MANTPVAHINLGAISRNFDLVRALAPSSKIMALVKANAYGHGATEVCKALAAADAFAVARVAEGVELREAGVEHSLFVLQGFIDAHEMNLCRINRMIPVLHSAYQVECLKRSRHAEMAVWIKIDTGMHRLGFSVEEFRKGMTEGSVLNVAGVMSHLANADNPDHQENRNQIQIFDDVTRDLDVELSVANSGAIMNYPNSHFDWVRPGIMLYGGSPSGEVDERLAPAMTLLAPVVAVNRVQRGESIGYGNSWFAREDTRVAVLSIGYADGYPREVPPEACVLIGGERRKIIGRISMDMMFVELAANDIVRQGDMATMWGAGLPVDEVGKTIGTIGYTLLSRLTPRVERRFVRDEEGR